ncbi:MAG: glycosyltransferase [Ignavibacteriales bacterium]|nr:glycosyltransferase [Ignavibacteriales bacterium]
MIILFLIFAAVSFYYLIFLIKIVNGLKIVKNDLDSNSLNEFVSVIIPFRNEENILQRNLASVESQSFPKDRYEIIYVDDNSDDNSVKVIEDNISSNNVRIIKSENNFNDRAHKKLALKMAIENSKGEIIITTDADCFHRRDWLSTMVKKFDMETGFVSGPVEFVDDGKIFSKLQKLEFSSLIIVGAALIGINEPIICNAANLGFRKSVFKLVNGYEDNLNLSSGDDEFLMQKISTRTDYKVKFCYDKNAVSYTHPNKTIKEFVNQRKRWASKSFYYVKKSITLKLLFIYIFYLSFLIQFLLGIFYDKLFFVSLMFNFIFKVFTENQIVRRESTDLFKKVSLKLFLLAEILHIPYIILAGFSGLFGNYEWKGRKVKR